MNADKEKLYAHVDFLTGIKPPRNYRNIDSLNNVADYIREEMYDIGCFIQEQPFQASGQTYRNIIGSVGPRHAPRIILGAHYDVAGDQPGADDNASAVAGLLETARLLMPWDKKIKKRIDFVAYCLEEPPFFGSATMGSAVHAESLQQESVEVEFMICYEMIGFFNDEVGSQSYPGIDLDVAYTDKGDFIIVVGIERYAGLAERLASLMQKHAQIRVESVDFPAPGGLVSLSDHKCYWDCDYPAVMLTDTSFLRNPHYHQVTDTIDTLDFERMKEVINGVAGALIDISKNE